jgi:hypothetical protein
MMEASNQRAPQQPVPTDTDPSPSTGISEGRSSQPGEMSQIFKSPSQQSIADKRLPRSIEPDSDLPNRFDPFPERRTVASTPAPGRAEPGTFTQFFQPPWHAGTSSPASGQVDTPTKSEQPEARSAPAKRTDSAAATRIFHATEGNLPRSTSGDSNFTRVLSRGSAASAPAKPFSVAPQAPAAPEPVEARDTGKLVVIIVLSVLFLIALIFTVYFAVNH